MILVLFILGKSCIAGRMPQQPKCIDGSNSVGGATAYTLPEERDKRGFACGSLYVHLEIITAIKVKKIQYIST